MHVIEMLCEMTVGQAIQAFSNLGVNVQGLDAAALKMARNKLINKHHPDRGGNLEIAKQINVAFEVLSGKAAAEKEYPNHWSITWIASCKRVSIASVIFMA